MILGQTVLEIYSLCYERHQSRWQQRQRSRPTDPMTIDIRPFGRKNVLMTKCDCCNAVESADGATCSLYCFAKVYPKRVVCYRVVCYRDAHILWYKCYHLLETSEMLHNSTWQLQQAYSTKLKWLCLGEFSKSNWKVMCFENGWKALCGSVAEASWNESQKSDAQFRQVPLIGGFLVQWLSLIMVTLIISLSLFYLSHHNIVQSIFTDIHRCAGH